MSTCLSSFKKFAFIDSTIMAERIAYPRRRQVASILLLNPDGKALCLAMSDKASEDGRLNLSPPQGEIEKYESLSAAAAREVREELDVGIRGKSLYLGSVVRTLNPDHKRAHEFDEYHHHWVVAFADSHAIMPQPPLQVANWFYFDTLSVISNNMSEAKRQMFMWSSANVFRRSGDSQLVRPEALYGPQQVVA